MIKNQKNRKDFLSIDKKTAISSEGDFFNVGDTVTHEGGEGQGVISEFTINKETYDVIAKTDKGTARISFLTRVK